MATVFEIIAVVAIVLAVFIACFVLPISARYLKKTYKSLRPVSRGLRDQVGTSITGIDAAQVQLDAFAQATSGIKAGMDSALRGADKAVSFLRSNTFQVGLPVTLWVLFLVVALPRGLRRPAKKKARKKEPVPPSSWEREAAES